MKLSTLIFCCFAFCRLVLGYNYPANEYEYSLRRDTLAKAEADFQGNLMELTEDEEVVSHYLHYLKWVEFQNTKDSGFAPARPIEEMMEHIVNSDVFRVLKKLPKGGDMHTHENHHLSKRLLLEIVWNSTDFEHLWMLPENHTTHPWKLDFFIKPPPNEGWLNVKDNGILIEEILPHQTLIGILNDTAKKYPTDSGLRWLHINQLWERGSVQLIANIAIKDKYLRAVILEGLDEGVQYIETRKNFEEAEWIYELDSDPQYNDTNGKHFLDKTGELDINITLQVIEEVQKERPEFIGFRRIVYTTRFSSQDHVKENMDRVFELYKKYPDHIIGFDLVAEEDAGRSHLFFLEQFLTLFDQDTQQSKLPLYQHVAETNWPVDLLSSNFDDDLVPSLQNAYESVILNSRRIGHGIGFIKRPYLLHTLRERNISFEICPVSNQILGFVPDLRNHPAINYFHSGIPVTLGPDDPGTFGHDYFTIDWYHVLVSWGFNLAELKKLALNSLEYSGMSNDQIVQAKQKWSQQWDIYIADTKTEACQSNTNQSETSFARILPRQGAHTGKTNVHVFGRHFESAICQTIKCKFGDMESPKAAYISNSHIICEAPDPSFVRRALHLANMAEPLNVTVSLDGGANYLYTGETFTYEFDPFTTAGPDFTTTDDSISGTPPLIPRFQYCSYMVIIAVLCKSVVF